MVGGIAGGLLFGVTAAIGGCMVGIVKDRKVVNPTTQGLIIQAGANRLPLNAANVKLILLNMRDCELRGMC